MIKITQYKIGDLISAEYNPRKLSEEQQSDLADSMKRFGFVDPVIVNTHEDRKNILVGGHQRVKTWKSMGETMVPAVEVCLNREEEKELNIRLNKNTGEWDLDMLKKHFDSEELSDWGFSEDEVESLFSELEGGMDDTQGDDEVPEGVEPRTRRGDVYELGKHRLVCGDAVNFGDIETLFGDFKADMYLTDPPYNVDYTGKTKDELKIKNDSFKDPEEFRSFLFESFTNAYTFMKAGAVFYIWHADLESYNFRGACNDSGLQVRQCLIWNKNCMVMGRQDYHWKHEPCLYGWKDGAAHLWNTDRTQTTILEFDRPNQSKLHPTMKPVALIAYQITNNTKGEDIVYDSFLGSGSTIIAAEKTGRICYGLELSEKYCDIIVQRYVDFCRENKKPIKVTRNGDDISKEYTV